MLCNVNPLTIISCRQFHWSDSHPDENLTSPGFSPGQREIASLFRRFAVEVFVVFFRFGACMMNNAIPMIRR